METLSCIQGDDSINPKNQVCIIKMKIVKIYLRGVKLHWCKDEERTGGRRLHIKSQLCVR